MRAGLGIMLWGLGIGHVYCVPSCSIVSHLLFAFYCEAGMKSLPVGQNGKSLPRVTPHGTHGFIVLVVPPCAAPQQCGVVR